MSRMSGDAGEDVGEPSLGIDTVHFGRDDETVHRRGAMPAAIGPAEQPRFSAQGNAPSAPRSAALFERQTRPSSRNRVKAGPTLENVIDRLDEVVPAGESGELRAHIDMEIVDQGSAQRPPNDQALLGVACH